MFSEAVATQQITDGGDESVQTIKGTATDNMSTQPHTQCVNLRQGADAVDWRERERHSS